MLIDKINEINALGKLDTLKGYLRNVGANLKYAKAGYSFSDSGWYCVLDADGYDRFLVYHYDIGKKLTLRYIEGKTPCVQECYPNIYLGEIADVFSIMAFATDESGNIIDIVQDAIDDETLKINKLNTEEGDAVKLVGYDSEGNLVEDTIPEGIVVDDALNAESSNAIANSAVSGAVANLESDLSEEYDATADYAVGDYCIHEQVLYKCKTAISGGEEWTAGHWEAVNVGGELDKKITKGAGVYDGTLGAGYATLAGNLDSKVVQNDQEPYLYRTSGGSLEIGNTCKENAIIGGTIFWNQLVSEISDNSGTVNGITYSWVSNRITVNNTAEANWAYSINNFSDCDIPAGHKLLLFVAKTDSNSQLLSEFAFKDAGGTIIYDSTRAASTIVSLSSNAKKIYVAVRCYIGNSFSSFNTNRPMVFDLTAMFGASVADFIYTLEQGEAGAGVAWFKRYFPKDYYPYCAPTPVNVKVRGKKRVGFNQWDEEWELGIYDWSNGTGAKVADTIRIRCKNYIPAIANQTYHGKLTGFVLYYDKDYGYINYSYVENTNFTTPANCAYLTFYCTATYGTTYNHDICLNFHYDGERDGEYEPYEEEIEALDPTWEGRGIFKLDSDNNLYADGDRYNYDGSVEVNYDYVSDLSALSWSVYSGNDKVRIATLNVNAVDNFGGNYLAEKGYECGYLKSTNTIYVNVGTSDSSVNPTGYLLYKLATPTSSSATPFSQIQSVDNWGTEEYLPPEGDTRPIEVPVGHDTDYPLDCKSKIEIAPDLPSSDGYYVCKIDSGTASYVAIGTWLSSNGYVKLTDITGYDDTKTQTLKNVEGTLTWVDDE